MKYMVTYDLMESMRLTNQWLGATAQAMGAHPVFAMTPNPAFKMLEAWGQVTERTFSRMVVKPDWNIPSVVGEDGRDHLVEVETVMERRFGDLIRFNVTERPTKPRKVLLVAPMSGHYATLLRSTVMSLLPDCEVYITDWHNARDIPVSSGKFDIEDYTLYLVDFMREMGPDSHVIAVCQPAPLALAATAYLAAEDPKAQPATLTLIGGPIDPDAAPTDVTDFGRRVTMGQLEETAQQRVGFKYPGVGRMVYPGLLQLASFMSMNSETHSRAFSEQILKSAKGEAADHDRHNKFYDEYLAVMDMPAEFYLSTVERIFKNGEIAKNEFVVDGKAVDIGKITSVAVKTVEGSKDDISAPGQCIAALDLLTGLPASKKASHVEDGAGHYGIFAGKSWRRNIRPLVLEFIDANSAAQTVTSAPAAAKPAAVTKPAAESQSKTAAPKAKPAAKPAAAKAKPAAVKPKAPVAKTAKPAAAKAKPAAAKPKATVAKTAGPTAANEKTKPSAAKAKPAETKTAAVKPKPAAKATKPAAAKAKADAVAKSSKPARVKSKAKPARAKS